MWQIKILKSLYTKQAILYTMNLYLEKYDFEISEDESNYIISFKSMKEQEFKFIKRELNFNSLRFEISNRNEELRKAIISKALGSINLE